MEADELLGPFERMLEAQCSSQVVRAIEAGGSPAGLWQVIAESGFLDALLAEDAGGFGLKLAQVAPLLQELGRHAVPLPVGETMVARMLLAEAGQEVPQGPITLAASQGQGRFVVPFSKVSELALVDDGEHLLLLPIQDAGQADDLGRASLDATIRLPDRSSLPSIPRPEGGVEPIAALLRAAAIAGAADRLLVMTIAYANERVQFGKPIGRQQALQQQLAVMAERVVAVRLAVQLGCSGTMPLSPLLAATAKSVASDAAPRIANSAHAVHGAIGISEEHDLQLYTRRLHDWRLAWGSESYWNARLGAARLADSANSVDWARERLFA